MAGGVPEMTELFDLAVMRREIEQDEKFAEGRKRAKQSDYVTQDEIETMWRRKWDGQQRNENS